MTFEQWFAAAHYNKPFIGELEPLFRDCWYQAEREGISHCIAKIGGMYGNADKDRPAEK